MKLKSRPPDDNYMENLIIDDTHGRYEKLMVMLENDGFNPAGNILYSADDFCDHGNQPE